jgi:hypothetical protein
VGFVSTPNRGLQLATDQQQKLVNRYAAVTQYDEWTTGRGSDRMHALCKSKYDGAVFLNLAPISVLLTTSSSPFLVCCCRCSREIRRLAVCAEDNNERERHRADGCRDTDAKSYVASSATMLARYLQSFSLRIERCNALVESTWGNPTSARACW